MEKKREKRKKKKKSKRRAKLNREITQEEVSKAINQLQNYKAPGRDGVIGEIIKAGGEKIREAIWMLCRVAWGHGESTEGLDAGSCVPAVQRWR